MTAPQKLLAFAGSLRRDSYNKRLAQRAADIARAAGAEVTYIDLRDFQMPLYDGDLEAEHGLPEAALRLKAVMGEHPAWFISTPEYNTSVPGMFKNAIDWASRSAPDEKALATFKGKVCALTSASPGAFGAVRALAHLRTILENIGTLVIPEKLSIPHAHEAFDEQGGLIEERHRKALERVVRELLHIGGRLNA